MVVTMDKEDDVATRIPRTDAEEMKIAVKSIKPRITWNAKVRELVRGYLDTRAANAELAAKAEAQ
jgi:hypothetical protein